MDSLIVGLQNVQVAPKVSEVFRNEIDYICNSVIEYYRLNNKIYLDVLDILCHCGHDLAYDVSDTFEQDCEWLRNYGKAYIYTYITSRINIRYVHDFNNIDSLINRIKDVYGI